MSSEWQSDMFRLQTGAFCSGSPMTSLDPDRLNTCSSSALEFFNGASIVVLTMYVLRQFRTAPIIAHIRHLKLRVYFML
jgi:hypothetical protein